MRGAGGTDGGIGMFLGGLALAGGAVYFFFDSVQVRTGIGALSGLMRRGTGGGGFYETTSMGILFVPFFVGVFCLFVDASRKWAWNLTYLGLAILAIEIVSRVRFVMNTKLTHLLGMLVMFAAGAAFMFRSYRASNKNLPGPQDAPRDL